MGHISCLADSVILILVIMLSCLVAGTEVVFWCLVRFFTGALSRGLYANPFEMAIQSEVACSEVKLKDGYLVSWC